MQLYTISHVAQAFKLNPVTVRKWLNDDENPLRTDSESGRGNKWRQFTPADLSRFGLLSHLVNELKIDSYASILLVNQLFDEITSWTKEATEAAQAEGTWRLVQSRWIFVREMTVDYLTAVDGAHLKPKKSFGELIDDIRGGCYPAILLDLTVIVMNAMGSTHNIKEWGNENASGASDAIQQPE
jgi:hypothetical protein